MSEAAVKKVRVRRRRRIRREERRRAQMKQWLGGLAASGLLIAASVAAVVSHWPETSGPAALAGGERVAGIEKDVTGAPKDESSPAATAASSPRSRLPRSGPSTFAVPQSLAPEMLCDAHFEPDELEQVVAQPGAGGGSGDDTREEGSLVVADAEAGGSSDGNAPVVILDFNAPTMPATGSGPYFGLPKTRTLNFASLPSNPFAPTGGSAGGRGGGGSGAALVVTDPLGGGGLGGAAISPSGGIAATTQTSGQNSGSTSPTDAGGSSSGAASAGGETVTASTDVPGPVVVSDGDVLGGTDTLVGGLILEGTGLLVPGHSPGIMTINPGKYEMTGGVLEIEIEGRDPSEFDRIEVLDGVAELSGGTIRFLFHDDFDPVDGDRFDFLFAEGGIIDDATFGIDTVDIEVVGLDPLLDFFIDTSNDQLLTLALFAVPQSQGVQLSLTQAQNQGGSVPAPAPATAWLLLAGCVGLGLRRRHQTRRSSHD